MLWLLIASFAYVVAATIATMTMMMPASDARNKALSGQGELAARLKAAQATAVNHHMYDTLVDVAKDAAAGGEGEIVKEALKGIENVTLRDKAAAECALKLNERGQRTLALEVAKTISLNDLRDQILDRLAKSRQIGEGS